MCRRCPTRPSSLTALDETRGAPLLQATADGEVGRDTPAVQAAWLALHVTGTPHASVWADGGRSIRYLWL